MGGLDLQRGRRRRNLATALACVAAVTFALLAPSADAASRTIRLGGGAQIIVPSGALPSSTKIVAKAVSKRRELDAAMRGRTYSLRLIGSGKLRKPIRVEIPFRASELNPNLNAADVLKVSIFVPGSGRWRNLPTRADYRRQMLIGVIRSLPKRPAKSVQARAIADQFRVGVFDGMRESLSQVLGSRQPQPTCPGTGPRWVKEWSTHFFKDPLLTCGGTDAGNANVFEYRIVNNRSYGVWLTFSHPPDWAWEESLGFDVTSIPTMYSRPGQYYVSAGNEIRLGFSDTGRASLSITSTPATETYVLELGRQIIYALGGISKVPDIKSMNAALSCADDVSSVLRGTASGASKAKDLVGRGIKCATQLADLDPTVSNKAVLKAGLRVLGLALTILDLTTYAGDVLEAAAGKNWTLVILRQQLVAPPTATPPVLPPTPPTLPPPPSPSNYVGHVVKWAAETPTPVTSWYVTGDLKRLWIPDGGTYNCLIARGAPGPTFLGASMLDRLIDQTGRWAPCGDHMRVNRVLRRNMSLQSSDGRYRLWLQNDGNFVLYGPSGSAIWANNRFTTQFVAMQGDGNLVGYTDAGAVTWASNTPGSGADRLVVQSDGNLVLYAAARAVWSTNTVGRP